MPQIDTKAIEKKWREYWEKQGIYKFRPESEKKIYSIDTPPPTVSGEMHIGHACSYSQQDFIARYKRMQGFNVFYPFGTDDNGLPTERLVEKTLKVKAKDMPRSDFIKLCMNFLKKELPKFIQDWKNIGMSCDWDIYYSTINEHSRRIAQWSFLDLHKKGRLYRKDAPTMWCPECKTGVAQVEAQDKEIDSTFNDIIFKVGNENLIIATTRPELLPSCVAIFYHPEDKRYQKLNGKKAKVPLFNFEVPILEDERADPKKGTGIVMCCTFGDQTDMEWQKAHNLPIKIILTEDGKMNNLTGEFKGMQIKEARKAIIQKLKDSKLLTKQIPIKHIVNVHERCGTEIEFIKSKQWFVKYLDLKSEMLKWGKEIKWHPEYMVHRYNNWVKGLQWDWLISNQRYFGVPFPVWYCKNCDTPILADEKHLPVEPLKDSPPAKTCPKCSSKNLIPETDVLNTWFTSSLTPQLAIQLMPKQIQEKLFPMDLRPQAHEIITFWLFNTTIKSRLHFNKTPWKNTMISGFVTLKGEKMSKSKGNIIRPQEVMEKYGSDAVRYWAASSKLGEDFDYQEKDVLTGAKFITKILNAANFVFSNIKEIPEKQPKLIETDRLFLSQLNNLIASSTNAFEEYNYSKAKAETNSFFWKEFCDNYLEIIKNRIYNGSAEEKLSASYTLYCSLLTILKLISPITPFITEELYQTHFKKAEKKLSIHTTSWPKQLEVKTKKDDNIIWNRFIEIITKIRQAKSEAKKSMKAEIILTLPKEDKKLLENLRGDLISVASIREIKEGKFNVMVL